jgi:hypothetical protein
LPYSWYDVTVAAYTVKKGTDAKVIGHTLELGNLYNLCIILIHRGRKKDIQFYFVFGVEVSNLRWGRLYACLQLGNKKGKHYMTMNICVK